MSLPAWLHSAIHQDSGQRAFDVPCPECGELLIGYSRGQILAGQIFCAVCQRHVSAELPACPFPHEEAHA